MDLHPCPSCGSAEFDRRSRLVDHQRTLVSVYRGECAGCGDERLFEFQLAEGPEPSAEDAVAYGGDQPSSIICPGQFLEVADRYAGSAKAPADELTSEERRRGRAAMEVAVGAMREVLKFIPPGHDRVPPEAFSSQTGRALYRSEPGRFGRARLLAVLDTYVEIARGYAVH